MDEMQRLIEYLIPVLVESAYFELVALMPNENFIFYGIQKMRPYGTKTFGRKCETHTGRCRVLKVAECKSTGCRMQHGDKRDDSHFKGKISERDPGHRN